MVLRTNEMDWAWRGDVTMYIPRVSLGAFCCCGALILEHSSGCCGYDK